MRWLGQSRRAFDMLCERAVSRHVHGSLLADKQMVQSWVADSMAEMTAARLMTLHAAWKMDRDGRAGGPRGDRHDQVLRRGSPLQRDRPRHPGARLARASRPTCRSSTCTARRGAARIYDGPDEVHKVTVARQVLKRYAPAEVPTEHVPTRREAAQRKFADLLAEVSAND